MNMPRILIIDDEKSVGITAKIVLDASGFEAVAVTDGKSGIEAVKQQAFDAVIVDLFMPGMNGLEVAAAIRKISPSTPIIAASGFMFGGDCPEMPNFREMAAEAGASAALYKPFRPQQLLDTVRQAIGVAA
jgi:CheY-like chemotaxis protein